MNQKIISKEEALERAKHNQSDAIFSHIHKAIGKGEFCTFLYSDMINEENKRSLRELGYEVIYNYINGSWRIGWDK